MESLTVVHRIACTSCHQMVSIPDVPENTQARCPRCRTALLSRRRNSPVKAVAYSITALLFLLLSLPYDFITLRATGQFNSVSLPTSFTSLIASDFAALALITLIVTVLIPALLLIVLITLNLVRLADKPTERAFKWVNFAYKLKHWSMADVFLIGILVSLIKLTSLAQIEFGVSFYCFIAFVVFLFLSLLYFDINEYKLWLVDNKIDCNNLTYCLDYQKPIQFSTQRTWALLLTAIILYIPANVYPIMTTELFGRSTPNTIIGGVIDLWQSDSHLVAIIIVFASIVIPITKIIVLAWLSIISRQVHINTPSTHNFYYQVTDWIGKWSMIDVFVVAILVSLIQLGNTMTVVPGPAAIAFCAVVFVTMLAAISFDPRTLWHSNPINQYD